MSFKLNKVWARKWKIVRSEVHDTQLAPGNSNFTESPFRISQSLSHSPTIGKTFLDLSFEISSVSMGSQLSAKCMAFIIDVNSNKKFVVESPLLRELKPNRDRYSNNTYTNLTTLTIASTETILEEKETLFPFNTLTVGIDIIVFTQPLTYGLRFLDLRNTLNDKTLSDFQIICRQKEFYVSKLILGNHSQVFRTMFESQMSEQKTNQLKIEDIDEEVMEEFIKFLYFRKSDKIEEFTEELLYVSDKYQVLELKKMCENLLYVEINVWNAIKLFRTFDKYNSIETKNKTIDFIVDNLKTIRVQSGDDLSKLIEESHKFIDDKSKDMFIELAVVDPKEPNKTQSNVYLYHFID